MEYRRHRQLFLLLPGFKEFELENGTIYVKLTPLILDDLLSYSDAFILRFLTSLLATMTGFVLTGMPDGFGICACHISDIDASIYTRLIQQRKTLPLLPRLSTLFLRTYGSGVLSILSPTLHSVVVSMVEFSRDDIPAVWVLMDVLSDTMAFHRLEKFSLELGDFHLPSLVRAPSRMTNLRQLSILEGTLTDLGILADLSTLPYLEDLGIDFSPFAAFATLSQFPLTPFVALKSLGIEAPALRLGAILEVLPVGGLQSLTISPLIEPFEPEKKCHASLARYFQIISSRFSASMTTLVVEWWHDSAFDDGLEMPPPKNAFNVSLFEPLFETRNLQKVDLSELHWAMETFGDEEFAKFASAWPAIQELKFPSYRMKATIRTLQSFATERPRLRHLEIPFDGQPVEESTLPMTSSPLETLSIGYTPIIPRKDESRLVRNLDRLFPSLQAVSDPLEKVLGFPAAHVEKSAHP